MKLIFVFIWLSLRAAIAQDEVSIRVDPGPGSPSFVVEVRLAGAVPSSVAVIVRPDGTVAIATPEAVPDALEPVLLGLRFPPGEADHTVEIELRPVDAPPPPGA